MSCIKTFQNIYLVCFICLCNNLGKMLPPVVENPQKVPSWKGLTEVFHQNLFYVFQVRKKAGLKSSEKLNAEQTCMFLGVFSVSSRALDIWGQSLGTVLMTDLLVTNRCSHFIAIWPGKELTGAFRALLRLTLDLSR